MFVRRLLLPLGLLALAGAVAASAAVNAGAFADRTLNAPSPVAELRRGGVEGCAEPDFIRDMLGVAGADFVVRESLACLPGGDTFTNAQIEWGDGTIGAGAIVGQQSGSASVEGQHVYSRPGSFSITVSVTDVQTGDIYATGWHTHAVIGEALPEPMPPSPPPVQPAPAPVPSPSTPTGQTARVHARGRRVLARRGIERSQIVATLSAPVAAGQLHARVAWGDGTSSSASIAGTAPNLRVDARHAWRRAGLFVVTVTITDAEHHVLARAFGRADVRRR